MRYNTAFAKNIGITTGIVVLCHLPLFVWYFGQPQWAMQITESFQLVATLLTIPPLLLLSLLRYERSTHSTFVMVMASRRTSVLLTLACQASLVTMLMLELENSSIFEFASIIFFSIFTDTIWSHSKGTTQQKPYSLGVMIVTLLTLLCIALSWGKNAEPVRGVLLTTIALLPIAAALKAIRLDELRDRACTLIPQSWMGLFALQAITTPNGHVSTGLSLALFLLIYIVTIAMLLANAQTVKPNGLVSILSSKKMQQEIAQVRQELAAQERKNLHFERKLADSSLLAAATLDNMSAQVCIIDANFNISATNKSWREFFASLSNADQKLLTIGSTLTFESVQNTHHRKSLERITTGLTKIKNHQVKRVSDLIEYTVDGQRKYFQLRISAFESPLGDRYLISQEDVSELKLAEEELQLKNIAIERANDGIVITDPTQDDNPIIYVSHGFLSVTGYAQKEVIGKNCRFMQGPKTSPQVVNEMRNAINNGQPFSGELVNYKKDGTIWFNRLKLEPIRNAEGQLIRYVGVQMDITASKLLETERKQALERATKAKQELERLYQEAQNANSIKDDFLATLSHELRTPAGVIVGFTELLKYEELTPPEKEEALDALERNSRALVTLIDDLLDMNRVITGKFKLSPKPVDVTAVVDSVISAELLAAQTKNIRIVTDFEPGAGPVYGDITRLQQIFWNLLSNAIKFTPRNGRVKVAIRTEGARLVVKVSDTGIGIDSKFLPHVFERFRQQTEGVSRTFGGLGLGLSIVKHLVELHGGQVYAESAGVGKGSTFIVSLPALTAAG